jgi:hypothetical protein
MSRPLAHTSIFQSTINTISYYVDYAIEETSICKLNENAVKKSKTWMRLMLVRNKIVDLGSKSI